MVFPVLIGREMSIQAVTMAIDAEKQIFVCTQKDASEDEPTPEGLYTSGCLAKIIQVLKLPNGLLKVLVEGLSPAEIVRFHTSDTGMVMVEITLERSNVDTSVRAEAMLRQLDTLFTDYVKSNRNLPNETVIAYQNQNDLERKMYFAAANLLVGVEHKIALIRPGDTLDKLQSLIQLLNHELEVITLEKEIEDKVHDAIQHSQRKFYLQEQIRVLQRELGEDDEYVSDEIDELSRRIVEAGMSEEAERKAFEELDKLKRMPPQSPESSVSRNYLDVLIALPWSNTSEDHLSVDEAAAVLNRDHYGLDKPKDRILEHIAVLNLVTNTILKRDPSSHVKGQILCLVGPPGVGKTSLGRSIASALGRQFVRISLGGVNDEAEIRGHRRTYIGSMPGKIIQAMRKAGTLNPVILLDEVDKMSQNFHGDPAAALLEVLDPEQNHTYNDHYLDVEFDLSRVMFITTANVRHTIPLPLQDRMEVIELPGYLEYEKMEIAKRHIIRRLQQEHGLAEWNIQFSDKGILRIIRDYTMEAGVRNLERSLATILRKIARRVVEETDGGVPKRRKRISITAESIDGYLGVPKFRRAARITGARSGSATGLAWTAAGGEVLQVDVTIMHGTERLRLTGQLGDVMKESAQAALSYIRSHADALGLPEGFFEKKEIHIHIPEGGIPKDGPSAGITMAVAMLSAMRQSPVPGTIGMTGEITLHGDILAIGGLTEKLLAARRHGVTTVLIPSDNERDLVEIAPEVKDGLTIVPVRNIREILPRVLPAHFHAR